MVSAFGAPALLAAAAFAALGTGHLDELISSSTGIDISQALGSFGVPLQLSLNLFSLLAAAIVIYSLWPRKPDVYVLDFAVFSPPER